MKNESLGFFDTLTSSTSIRALAAGLTVFGVGIATVRFADDFIQANQLPAVEYVRKETDDSIIYRVQDAQYRKQTGIFQADADIKVATLIVPKNKDEIPEIKITKEVQPTFMGVAYGKANASFTVTANKNYFRDLNILNPPQDFTGKLDISSKEAFNDYARDYARQLEKDMAHTRCVQTVSADGKATVAVDHTYKYTLREEYDQRVEDFKQAAMDLTAFTGIYLTAFFPIIPAVALGVADAAIKRNGAS